jgi:hypothetical protein
MSRRLATHGFGGFMRRAVRVFRAITLAATSGVLAACSVEVGPHEDLEQSELAQQNDDPPPGCGSWDIISTEFIEDCLLSGGDSIQCSGGDIFCCKSSSDGGRHCSTDPNDLDLANISDVVAGPLENAPVSTSTTPTKIVPKKLATVNP